MKKLLIVLLLLTAPLLMIYSHPHINIHAYTYYYFDNKGLIGLYVQWIYDPLFSSQIIYECDTDEDMVLSADEIEQVRSYYFTRLSSDGCFTRITLDRTDIPIPTPLNFSAAIDKEDEVVIFTFYLPLEEPYSRGKNRLTVAFADPTNYTAFICPQRAVAVEGATHKITDVYINRLGSIAFTY